MITDAEEVLAKLKLLVPTSREHKNIEAIMYRGLVEGKAIRIKKCEARVEMLEADAAAKRRD